MSIRLSNRTFAFMEKLVYTAQIFTFFMRSLRSGEATLAIPTGLNENSLLEYQECISSKYEAKYLCHRSYYHNRTTDFAPCLSKYTTEKGSTIHFLGDSVTAEIYSSLRCSFPMLNLRYYSIKRKSNRLSPAKTYATTVKANLQDGDVVVLNFGLWYNLYEHDLKQYKKDLSELASYLKYPTRPDIRHIWMHSSAQHFCTTDGTYHRMKSRRAAKKCCKPKIVSRLRQDLAENILLKNTGLEIFDLHGKTSERWSDHLGSGDCTHFCIDYGGLIHEVGNKLLSETCKSDN